MPLLAEARNDGGEIALGGGGNQVGGARPALAHAHVERAVETEGEAALGFVELHRRDADIEHDTIDGVVAASRATASRWEKRSSISVETAFRRLHEIESACDRALVAVDADHPAIGRVENGAGIAAGAESAVDIDAAIARREEVQRLSGEHGNVPGQSASDSVSAVAARHHSRAPCGFAARSAPSRLRSTRIFPVASASSASNVAGIDTGPLESSRNAKLETKWSIAALAMRNPRNCSQIRGYLGDHLLLMAVKQGGRAAPARLKCRRGAVFFIRY